MKVELVSIRDRLTGFSWPQVEYNIDVAKRNFADSIRKNEHFGEHINDFSLYRLGSFDTDNGIVLVPDVPELICSAFDVTGGKSDAGSD